MMCYCYPCPVFGSTGGGSSSQPVQVFTVSGFRNWKHATGKTGSLSVLDTFVPQACNGCLGLLQGYS